MVINSRDIMTAAVLAIEMWKKNIFPALFPFFILSDLLINYGLIDVLGNIFKKPMNYIFKFDKSSIFIFFMSMFTGFPSSSRFASKLLKENLLDIDSANRIIACSHFSNPLFIFGTIYSMLNNTKICLIILISHYLGNIIIAFFTRNYNKISSDKIYKIKKQSFTDCLTNSIINNTNTLLFILGTITIFFIIGAIINKYVINDLYIAIISGILEMTQGIRNISLSSFNIVLKTILITFFISFGGLCVHIQTIGIINNTPIKYSKFLKARIIHSIISCLLAYIFMKFFLL